jgi:hypothetical protein
MWPSVALVPMSITHLGQRVSGWNRMSYCTSVRPAPVADSASFQWPSNAVTPCPVPGTMVKWSDRRSASHETSASYQTSETGQGMSSSA